jgi:hypothetical protein
MGSVMDTPRFATHRKASQSLPQTVHVPAYCQVPPLPRLTRFAVRRLSYNTYIPTNNEPSSLSWKAMPPSNGFSVFCRNHNNGASSSCDATCASGYSLFFSASSSMLICVLSSYVYVNGVCAKEKITNTYCMSLVPPGRPGLIGPSASNLNQCECVPNVVTLTSRPCPGFQKYFL